MVEPTVDNLLDQIYSGAAEENYTLKFTGLDNEIAAEVAAMAQKWNVAAKNGSIAGFNKESGEFLYDDEQNGLKIDETKLTQDIKSALESKNFNTVITANSEVITPEITKEQAKAMYKVIGTFTTNTTQNKDRNTNISLAAQAIDGVIIPLDGVLIEEPGGGVCQVSSTLYNAVVFSGLETTERHAHTFEPTYCTPGEDAMVSYDGYAGPDMKFKNNSSTAIAIRAKLVEQKLSVSIVGMPILEEGVKISMESKKISENDDSVIQYEEDDSLPMGESREIKPATKGSRWETKLIKKKGNEVISSEFFHNSTYKGKGPIIKRNTAATAPPKSNQGSAASGNANTSLTSKKASKSSKSSSSSDSETIESRPDGSKTSSSSATRPGETTTKSSSGEPGSSSKHTKDSSGAKTSSAKASSTTQRSQGATETTEETIAPLNPNN